MLEENTNLPEWVQSKITLAEDYISTVRNYMKAEQVDEATYKGKEVPLNKPMAGDVKKRKVYVDPDGDGKAKKVEFGDTTGLTIKTSDPDRRRNFRARHNCDQKRDKTTAGYWSCKAWSAPTVKKGLGSK